MFEQMPLYMQAGVQTRQISGENPTGEKNGGCKTIPDPNDPDLPHSRPASKLGQGWKVHPFISIAAGETAELANIQGPGCINEFFITSNTKFFSELVIRIYWDDEIIPSVESPMGALFAMGHDFAIHTVSSAMVTVAPVRGLNSYWQMPFRKSARITLSNEGPKLVEVVAYRILYKLYEIPSDAAYFHAQYRRSMTLPENAEHVIIDGIKGKGVYVGTYIACNVLVSAWWGEGLVKFYLDGDEFPSIVDNGTEDYFGGAWNFGASTAFYDSEFEQAEQSFCSPYLGIPLAKAENPHGPRKYSMYRWHVMDSIGFSEDFRATIQALGWYPNMDYYRPCPMDIASVAYWYQTEPHNKFPRLPSTEHRYDL